MLFNPALTLGKVAHLLNADFAGDPDFTITGLNEIHRVVPGDITFVDHPKYYEKALRSAASTIIINKKTEAPQGKVLIFSEDPFRDFTFLINRFRPFESATGMISSSAIIGEGTVIQPGTFVGKQVVIGRNCLIHANVTIYDHSVIGDNVIIHSGSVIGSDGFYFKRRPAYYDKLISGGRVILEDSVEIGANCTIDKGVTSDTIIGQGTKLDNLIQIGHDTVIGRNCLFAAHVGVAGCVNIQDDVILWGQVGVQKDLTIGKGAIVLGQSGVSKSLAGGRTYFGSPAREAREKMKEIAFLRRIPELFNRQK
ncbi:MAG: UDP-3-O-(3-hydroxymyristoyl)glucosamine N-acyltransferase [Bacteroidales bacterium]